MTTHPTPTGPPSPPRPTRAVELDDPYATGEPHSYSTLHVELDRELQFRRAFQASDALPPLAEVVSEASGLLAQAVRVLRRQVDPASEPDVLAYPAVSDTIRVHDVLIPDALAAIGAARRALQKVAQIPARQDPEAPGAVGLSRIATPDGPGTTSGQGTVSHHDSVDSPRTAPGRTRTEGSECSDPLPGRRHPLGYLGPVR